MRQDVPLNLDYNPVVFLRCHSKTDKDCADVRTEIWQIEFHPSKPNLIATCGGNKICVINLITNAVEQRYSAKNSESLFALNWCKIMIDKRENDMIIVGGELCVLYFISPEKKNQLTHFSVPKTGKSSKIFSLTFHPDETNMFFCAMSRGDINLLQVDSSSKSSLKVDVIITFSCYSEINRTAVCSYSSTLFAATNSGLCGWCTKIENYDEWKKKKISFNLLINHNNKKPDNEIVDSVEILGDGFVAVKYSLHGFIYIWHVQHSIVNSEPESRVIDIEPLYKLIWSLCDNYYMEMSYNCDLGLLICGDNEGSIWIYDIACLKDDDCTSSETKIIEVAKIIKWPEIEDVYHMKSKKLSLETEDIVIGKAVLSSNGKYLVAITNRNAVCLWSRN